MIQTIEREKTLGDVAASHKGLGVQFAPERCHHTSPDHGLQPVGFVLDRVIKRLTRQFAISQAHAKAVAELSGVGGRQ